MREGGRRVLHPLVLEQYTQYWMDNRPLTPKSVYGYTHVQRSERRGDGAGGRKERRVFWGRRKKTRFEGAEGGKQGGEERHSTQNDSRTEV